MIVLGVLAAVIGAIWLTATNVNQAANIKKANEELVVLVQNVRSSYAGSGRFTQAVGTPIHVLLRDKGLVLPSMIDPNRFLYHPWMKPIDNGTGPNHRVSVLVGPGNQSTFTISYQFPNDIRGRRSCTNFLMANLRNGAVQVYGFTTLSGFRNTNNLAALETDRLVCATLPANGQYGAHFVYRL